MDQLKDDPFVIVWIENGPINFSWDVSFSRGLGVCSRGGEWVIFVQIDSDYRSYECRIWTTIVLSKNVEQMYLGRKGLCIKTVLTLKVCQLLSSSECHSQPDLMAGAEERRAKILRDYCELTRTHPNLPAQLRDFQVKEMYQKTVSQYI